MANEHTEVKTAYFSHDRSFYRSFFYVLLMVSLQNVVNYSINMADNIMLGSYSQSALSGASCVNQFFFVVQCVMSNLGAALTMIASQYWGEGRTQPICRLGGITLRYSLFVGLLAFALLALLPAQIVGLFTNDAAIIAEGAAYISILKYSIPLYCISITLMDILRSVETVRISFVLSVVSLVINVGINYILIFGRLGFAPMGVTGAAIGTLAARAVEFLILLWYMEAKERKLRLYHSDFLQAHPELQRDYWRVALPVLAAGITWSLATPVQTAILGHVSSDAIAANSVATTFYQYLKVFATATGSAALVVTGKTVGLGSRDQVRSAAHSVELIALLVGVTLAALLYILRTPLLQAYTLSESALALADQLIVLMCVIMVFMAYQVPILFGVLRGAGDTKFSSYQNVIFVWGASIPLALLSAFVWKWDVVGIVACIQADQVLKCIPAFIRLHCTDSWIKKLTA